ncbi:MAG: hypothetical protein A2622_05450 [Bdellovibrionales bacterium RIFCSPHIGHO2_01_FULL_40_29]|nr:MAG: hypothetical protein A2622_05450 [Bdellovibrionales bacterium RIFCSPHIGHO2_01_FULL_40_29]OFZ33179.1 MAG: hypothetical protein A3D17_13420 [Bdellovibrionales bacterium RIFCSPHIGHO2_02_FULL_40_15]
MCLSLSFTICLAAEPQVIFSKKKIRLAGKILTVEIAETEEQHERGLMFREKLHPNEGMLFVFADQQTRSFWMKNTIINLSIGYFDKDRKLVDIQEMKAVTSIIQQDLPAYPSKAPAMYALEMSEGWFQKNKVKLGTSFQLL